MALLQKFTYWKSSLPLSLFFQIYGFTLFSAANDQVTDTIQLKQAKGLYVTDLVLKHIVATQEIELRWKTHPHLTTFIVEIRNEDTDSLMYQERHYTKQAVFPESGLFSVYPLTTYRRGIPVNISLSQALKNGFTPQNTARHLQIKEKKAARDKLQQQRNLEIANAQKEADNKRSFFANLRGAVTFVVFGIFSLFVVLFIWLVSRYKNRPINTTYNLQSDSDFESFS